MRPPPGGHPRFPLMDGLRGLAVLAVVLFHQGQIDGSNAHDWWGVVMARLNVGVPVFFVLSGFLLYRPFLAAWRGHASRVRFRDYARRRVLRILPAYWLALTLLALTVGLVDVFTHRWWIYYGFLQIYDTDWIFNGITAAWSLCVEATFYALLPLYVLARTRRPPEPGARWVRQDLIVLGAIAAVSLAFRAALKAEGHHVALTSSLLGTADWFAIGLALAVLSVAHVEGAGGRVPRLAASHPTACWALAAAVFAVTCAVGLPRFPHDSGFPGGYSVGQFMGEHVLDAAVALFLVLPTVFAGRGAHLPGRVLGHRLVWWVGIVSYGVFLYHAPLQLWLQQHRVGARLPGSTAIDNILVGLALSLAAAAASYALVERPLMRLKYRQAGGSLRLSRP